MLTKDESKINIYRVSQLIFETEFLLSQKFSVIWVEGEVSNLSCPRSGHLYFSLKDETSQIRCAFFKSNLFGLDFDLEEGMQLRLKARPAIYAARGDFQLIVEQAELAGEGALRQAFERLKLKLEKEGLFALDQKKSLPKFPRAIGVITSNTGAAVQDILHVLKRRFPSIPILIYPVLVQGEQAAEQIVQALKIANETKACDLLILARGGGSLEDLLPFNQENVARAIFASQLPIITGIGHETDFTIADFVADVRTPTPSAAAEIATPDRVELQVQVNQLLHRLNRAIDLKLKHLHGNVSYLNKRLQHPSSQLNRQTAQLHHLNQRLQKGMAYYLSMQQQKLAGLTKTLNTVSPLNTLERGYAIAMQDKTILVDAEQVKSGQRITVKLAKGELVCEVVIAKRDIL